MKVLRFTLLVILLLAVYFAQYAFDNLSLDTFFPAWALARFPGLAIYRFWLPEDVLLLALWMAAFGCIGFGLLAPQWTGAQPRGNFSFSGEEIKRTRSTERIGLVLLALAIGLGIYSILQFGPGSEESIAVQILWLGSILTYLVGAALLKRRASDSSRDVREASATPERSWPLLLLILIGAGIIFTWQWVQIPVRIDASVAHIGLQAVDLLAGRQTGILHIASDGHFFLAHIPTALAILLAGDTLSGIRLVGLYAGLLAATATWLVGCELFRRTPIQGRYGEMVEDDGRWMALLSTAILVVGYAFIHFSRLPVYLEAVAWGSLGLWSLLRALRTGDRFALALAGVLAGLAPLIAPGGAVFLPIGLLCWAGVWLLQRDWLRSFARQGRSSVWPEFLLWVGGSVVVLAPAIGSFVRQPAALAIYFANGASYQLSEFPLSWLGELSSAFWTNVSRSLLAFNILPDTSTVFGFSGHLLGSILAPLFVLAVGALILNLDQLIGWTLLCWIGATLVLASVADLNAPFWPMMLPLLPAAALAIAFAIDRIRALLVDTLGTWARQAAIYLAIGLVCWSLIYNWLDYYEFTRHDDSASSYAARVVRLTASNRPVGLVGDSSADALDWNDPVMALLAGERRLSHLNLRLTPDAWPTDLPPSTLVLLPAADAIYLSDLQQRYPGGKLQLARNHQANPVLYIYELP